MDVCSYTELIQVCSILCVQSSVCLYALDVMKFSEAMSASFARVLGGAKEVCVCIWTEWYSTKTMVFQYSVAIARLFASCQDLTTQQAASGCAVAT